MFNFFKKKSKSDKLQEKYEKLMKEWHDLSKINRAASDTKYAEAQAVMDEIKLIEEQEAH